MEVTWYDKLPTFFEVEVGEGDEEEESERQETVAGVVSVQQRIVDLRARAVLRSPLAPRTVRVLLERSHEHVHWEAGALVQFKCVNWSYLYPYKRTRDYIPGRSSTDTRTRTHVSPLMRRGARPGCASCANRLM